MLKGLRLFLCSVECMPGTNQVKSQLVGASWEHCSYRMDVCLCLPFHCPWLAAQYSLACV